MPDPASASDWSSRLAGDNCPYCPPRLRLSHRLLQVAPLTASTLYLNKDQRFRGYCLLVYDSSHATTLDALPPEAYTAFLADLRRASAAVRAVLRPDHLNVECLGNQTPHLHWHIVPRFLDDPRWGYPIWDGQPFEPRYDAVPEPALMALRNSLRARLAAAA